MLVPIQYKDSIQSQVKDELSNIIAELSAYISSLPDKVADTIMKQGIISRTTESALLQYFDALRLLEPAFKNPAFSEEAEWRVVYHPGNVETTNQPTRGFQFYRDDVVPYFEYPIWPALQKVRLGPLCKASTGVISGFFSPKWIKVCTSKATLIARD
jgi:hypothetical protein